MDYQTRSSSFRIQWSETVLLQHGDFCNGEYFLPVEFLCGFDLIFNLLVGFTHGCLLLLDDEGNGPKINVLKLVKETE